MRDLLVLIAMGGLAALPGCAPSDPAAKATARPADAELAVVAVVKPERKTVRRTTTQPATVRAWFRTEVHSRAAGYLRELNVDIGDEVSEGSVLGVVDVPDLDKRGEREEAEVRRLEAAARMAAAAVDVAGADVDSHQAMLEEARARISENRAQLQGLELEYQRVQAMVKDRAGTQQELDAAEASYRSSLATKLAVEAAAVSAEANVALARARLEAAEAGLASAKAETDVARRALDELVARISYARLAAPFPGVVVERNVDPGDLVRDTSTGRDEEPLFVVAQIERVRVMVPVPERDVPWVTVGDEVTLNLQAGPARPLVGTVDRVAGDLDESTRTMLVEIDLPNDDRRLLPGMFGEATIVLDQHEAIVLPASAVRHDEAGHAGIWVLDAEDRVQAVDIVTGLDTGQEIEITEGLQGDERVVLSGLGRIRPGVKVKVGV